MKKIYKFQVALSESGFYDFPKNAITRTFEISGGVSLSRLAEAIIDAFDFDMDHAYGFYDNLKNHYKSREVYTLFADMGMDDDPFNGNSVKIKVNKVFEIGKSMLFLFDYGDEWIFHVHCIEVKEADANVKYPLLVEAKGEAPEQYPDFEDEDDE